ncbi:hypothetical protein GGS23DRAFT_612110 [Durotheca rogersii]|uniref:uncharacterized protein n=1 Tax=Durotheca rogersii TaxID=419775 RepID=UPI0022203B5E|nr:uncharacterized protein GGS23DRAFT_612110 [Durotheca rogersii]KAI5861146.1 hypothetical protein GGS23DRAFT_612110 [Durotheca rogersii]
MPPPVVPRSGEMPKTAPEKPPPPPPQQQKRQRPGNACEACRRRKLRCDRGQPQCSACKAAGAVCQVQASRRPGGPRRGYLKTLQARISALEGSVLEHQHQQHPHPQFPPAMALSPALTSPDMTDVDPIQLSWDFGDGGLEDPGSVLDLSMTPPGDGDPMVIPPGDLKPGPYPDMTQLMHAPVAVPADEFPISSLMQADLDQLYFDRIHHLVPIIHRRRCLAWRRRPDRRPAHVALQYAVWTLAAAGSANYHGLLGALYRRARAALEGGAADLDPRDAELASSADVEQAQAWLLLAVHEFMCVGFRRACLTAGRALTLVRVNCPQWLLLRRDGGGGGSSDAAAPADDDDPPDDPVDAEQKRRVFWLAFCLDRLISLRTGAAPTFSEQLAARVRLPAPEADFQSAPPLPQQPGSSSSAAAAPGLLLAEAISPAPADYGTGRVATPAFGLFVECIVAAAVGGRVVLHRQQEGGGSSDFWARHAALDALAARRMDVFSRNYALRLDGGVGDDDDPCPMQLFVATLWRAVLLCLHQPTYGGATPSSFASLSSPSPPTASAAAAAAAAAPLDDQHANAKDFYVRRLALASHDIVRLAGKMAGLNCWKLHPLLPIPLSVCGEILGANRELGETYSRQLENIAEVMPGLRCSRLEMHPR